MYNFTDNSFKGVEVLPIKPITEEKLNKTEFDDQGLLVGETPVASCIKIFNAIARQVQSK